MGNSNPAVTVISAIIVIGVFIGLIASGLHNSSEEENAKLTDTSQMVARVCGPTDYKQACVGSMFSAAANKSSSPKDYIEASFNFTIFKVKEAILRIDRLPPTTHNATLTMAVHDCKDLMEYAIEELQASLHVISSHPLPALFDHRPLLSNWLTAVVSYHDACLDGVTHPDVNAELRIALHNSTHLSINCLAIVSSISAILDDFQIPYHNTTTTSSSSSSSRRRRRRRRRLLLSTDSDSDSDSDDINKRKRKPKPKQQVKLKPNATVAVDGSGQFRSIGEAIAAYPAFTSKNKKKKKKKRNIRYFIYVKAGLYIENLKVSKEKINVYMYGDGPTKTVVTGNRNFHAGVPVLQTATLVAIGAGFICKGMGFENTAGPVGQQAVAVRVQSDMSAFYNCRMDGYQGTLHAQAHRQFYRNCVISGSIDFIHGDASAVIQNSVIIVRKPLEGQVNTVTAQGRSDKHQVSGLVIHHCVIVPEKQLFPVRTLVRTYLGRPCKAYSRTVVMESTIGDLIQPAGWMEWDGKFGVNTLMYGEYANRGPGANTTHRVKWKGFKVIADKKEALRYAPALFLQGKTWLPNTATPYILGLTN